MNEPITKTINDMLKSKSVNVRIERGINLSKLVMALDAAGLKVSAKNGNLKIGEKL